MDGWKGRGQDGFLEAFGHQTRLLLATQYEHTLRFLLI